MKGVSTVIAVLLLAGAQSAAGADMTIAGPGPAPPPLAGALTGNTVSAVAYVPHPPGMPGGGELSRFMFQAYLRADGGAAVRVWDTARDSYTATADRRWTLSGSTLCIDMTSLGPGIVCADVHVWGPRIAGIGTRPYAMLDGDITPGDVLRSGR